MENRNFISISFDDEVPLLQAVKTQGKQGNHFRCNDPVPCPWYG